MPVKGGEGGGGAPFEMCMHMMGPLVEICIRRVGPPAEKV